ncbi:MAG: methyltransferase domain-containing protein [Planctomycetota bacterium]
MPKTKPFEEYSNAYDEWFERNHDIYDGELEAIRRLIPLPEVKGVEVGVGSGRFAAPLGIRIGVDPAEKMAIKAKRRGINVCRGVAENLPFCDGEFDFVLMVTTICFVDDIIRSFREVLRILKPGGCIIVGLVDKESELGRQYLDKRHRSRFYKEATFFSTEEVQNYLKEAGFHTVKIKQALIFGETQETILDGFGKGPFVVIRSVK